MTGSLPTLGGLVELVDASTDDRTPLGRLREASRMAADLGELGDRLLDQFVGEARAQGCSWAEIGQVLGVSKQAAQQRYVSPAATLGAWPERFGEPARAALATAAKEARALRHNYIGTEHVLLGLAAEGEGMAAQALALLGVTPKEIRAQIRALIGEGPGQPHGELGITPRTKRAFEGARRVAKQLGHNCVRSEHLLLALAESDGVASRILEALGAPSQRVREQVAEMLAVDVPELAARLLPKRRRLRTRRTRT
jgi:hypothetical protein